MPKPDILRIVTVILLAYLAGCKILPTPTEESKAEAAAQAFNPDRMAAEMWAPKVMPYLKAKAGRFQEVSALAKIDPKAAGEKYGNARKQANSPWTYVASVDGKIVASNTQSRAAAIDVDVDGDGKPDVRAQIGPAIRGTALRDVLDFVDFNAFTNQIDFAQFGKSFNTYVNVNVLTKLPREGLDGKQVKLLGAYVPGSGADLPLDDAGGSRDRTMTVEHDVILRLEDVSKVYFGTVAVKRANFEVRRGAVNVLVGENGAGKSTLMKIIAGVEKPTHGRILLEGEEVSFSSSGDAVARGIGMVFQELNLFGNLTRCREHFRDARDHPGGVPYRPQGAGAARRRIPRSPAGRHPSRHAGGGSADRPAATGRDRQGGVARCQDPDHGRADLGAERSRGRGPVQGHRRPEAPGRGDRLHLAPAGGTDPHRRLHHRAARRSHHRPGGDARTSTHSGSCGR